MTARCRYGQDGPWVFGQCQRGHCWHEHGEGICWRQCCRDGHTAYTPAHRAQAAWLAAREQAEKAS